MLEDLGALPSDARSEGEKEEKGKFLKKNKNKKEESKKNKGLLMKREFEKK